MKLYVDARLGRLGPALPDRDIDRDCFGPSQVQFRLASLNPFEIAVDFPDDAGDLLRFIG